MVITETEEAIVVCEIIVRVSLKRGLYHDLSSLIN